MNYKTPFPTSNRDFAELILTRDQPTDDTPGGRSFLVVSIPVLDTPVTKGHVRGKYISVEHVQEITEGACATRIQWRYSVFPSGYSRAQLTSICSMATASTAGGQLPQMATDMAVGKLCRLAIPAQG